MLNGVVLIEPFHIIQSQSPHTIFMVFENILLLFMTLRNRHSILILHVLFWEEIIVDVLLVGIHFLEDISSLDDRFH